MSKSSFSHFWVSKYFDHFIVVFGLKNFLLSFLDQKSFYSHFYVKIFWSFYSYFWLKKKFLVTFYCWKKFYENKKHLRNDGFWLKIKKKNTGKKKNKKKD